MVVVEDILKALGTIRLSFVSLSENEVHFAIRKTFDKYGIPYEHEYRLLPRKRFDFWIDGIVVEVKKQKPSKIYLLNQLNRYTKDAAVKAVIVVLERSMDLPRILNNKRIFCVSLNMNWGIAI